MAMLYEEVERRISRYMPYHEVKALKTADRMLTEVGQTARAEAAMVDLRWQAASVDWADWSY